MARPSPGVEVSHAESCRQPKTTKAVVKNKTGLISQGMTEKPGEFSNWYNSRITWTIGPGLYRTGTETQWAIKERFLVLPEIQSRNLSIINHGFLFASTKIKKYSLCFMITPLN